MGPGRDPRMRRVRRVTHRPSKGALVTDRYEHVIYERKGRIAYLTMNRPERLNALNRKHQEEIEAAKAEFANDPEAWVLILTGAGDRAFCAGADLKETSPRRRGRQPTWPTGSRCQVHPSRLEANDRRHQRLGDGRRIGLCDAVATSGSPRRPLTWDTQSLASVSRAVPAIIGSFPVMSPFGEAMYYLLTAEPMDAHEAYRIGLVHEVLAPEALLPRAKAIAERIASNHPMAVRAIKQAVTIGLSQSLRHVDALRPTALPACPRKRRCDRSTTGVSREAPTRVSEASDR